jgi:hypothetical protein
MALIASASSGGTSTPAPSGTHVARCVQVIDLGTQKDDGKYGLKIQPKLRLTWELPTELHTFREENGEEPFVVGKEYTLNLGDKSNLRKDLESWRGRPFTPQELEGFDVSKLLGAVCMLNIVHKPKADGSGVYANIAGISPLMKGITCPPAVMALLCYEVSMGRNEVFGKIPEWLRKKIEGCENWKQQAKPEPEPDEAHTVGDGTALHSDSIPF